MAKDALNFRDFLTSLTSVPIKIKNKELAEIFHVSDGVISKIRHGKMASIPINMRPLSNADRFAGLVVGRFAAAVSTVETFVIYANQIAERYAVSDNLKKKIDAIIWFDATKENHMEHVDSMYHNEIPAFLSSCYSEAYYNTSSAIPRQEGGKAKTAEGSRGAGPDALPREDLLSDAQLRDLFWKTGRRLYGGLDSGTENEAEFPLIYGLIFQEAQNPYYEFSRRSEQLSLTETDDGKTALLRDVDLLEQLVLPREEPIPISFQERLDGNPAIPDEELIQRAIRRFVCRINDVPVQEYVYEHERIHAPDLYELFRVTRVEKNEYGEPYVLLELPFYLYPEEHRNSIRLETKYSVWCEWDNFSRVRVNWKLKRACRFLEHEFSIEEESAKRFGLNLDIFAPFLYDTNAQFESPMSEKRIYTNGSKDEAHGRVTFYDWALPGSGYAINLYRLKRPDGE